MEPKVAVAYSFKKTYYRLAMSCSFYVIFILVRVYLTATSYNFFMLSARWQKGLVNVITGIRTPCTRAWRWKSTFRWTTADTSNVSYPTTRCISKMKENTERKYKKLIKFKTVTDLFIYFIGTVFWRVFHYV